MLFADAGMSDLTVGGILVTVIGVLGAAWKAYTDGKFSKRLTEAETKLEACQEAHVAGESDRKEMKAQLAECVADRARLWERITAFLAKAAGTKEHEPLNDQSPNP